MVSECVSSQIKSGNNNIVGVMIESNINPGNQKLDVKKTNLSELKYGVSVTDECIDMETNYKILQQLATAVRKRRSKNIY